MDKVEPQDEPPLASYLKQPPNQAKGQGDHGGSPLQAHG